MPWFKFVHPEKRVPDAYHGTLSENVPSILENGFAPSHGERLHLGTGVYFYESSAAWAEYWARRRASSVPHGAKVAVLKAEIRLGRCIDLSDRAHQRILGKFAKDLERRVLSGSLAGEFDKITEAFIFNLAAQRSNADTIRAPYASTEPRQPIHRWSRFDFSTRLVICVRRTENIENTTVFLLET